MEYNIVGEKEEYREIGLRGFDYKLFQEEEGGGAKGPRWVSIFEAYN